MYRIFISFCSAFVASSATLLHDAILRDADMETLTSLAADPNVKNANNVPVLHVAVASDNYGAAQLLVKLGADLNSMDASKACPIHYATCSNNLRMVNLLLENEANANCVDVEGRSALLMAARYGYVDIFKALIFNNPKKDTRVSIMDHRRWNVYHYAAHGNHDEIIYMMSYERTSRSARNNLRNTPINLAIIAGNNQAAFALIYVQVYAWNNGGGEELRLAAKYGRKYVLLELLKVGCNLESKDDEGRTALMIAVDLPKNGAVDDHFVACNDRTEIVKVLISAGANLEAVDNLGKNAAQLAFECENYSAFLVISKAMIADSNKRSFMQEIPVTPSGKSVMPELHWEITKGTPDLKRIRTLLVPDKINATDYLDRSAIHLAVDANCVEIVKELISNKIDLTSKTPLGDTVLHLAKSPEMAEILLRASPKLSDIANELGLLPLHTAVEKKLEDVVEILAPVTTYVRATDNPFVVMPDNVLCIAAHGGSVKIMECLLKNGAGKFIGTNGISALHTAADIEDIEMVHFLLQNGWSSTNTSKYGKIAVHQPLIAARNNIDLIRNLMHHVKPDHVTTWPRGFSFLHWVAAYGHEPNTEVVKVLIEEFGVPLNLKTYRGKTALHIFARWNDVKAARILIDKGANVALKALNGNTAIHLACKYRNLESAAMLMNVNRDLLSWKNFNDQTPIDLLLKSNGSDSDKANVKRIMVALELTPEDVPPTKLKLALSYFSKFFVNFVDGLREPITFKDYVNRAMEYFSKDYWIDGEIDVDGFSFKALGIFYAIAATYYPELAVSDTLTTDVEGNNKKMREYRDDVEAFEAGKYKRDYFNKLRFMLVESFMTKEGRKRFGGTYMNYIPQDIIDDTLIEVANNGNVYGRMELVANSLMLSLESRSELHQYLDVLWGQMIRLSKLIVP